MPLIHWNDELSVGVAEIDQQHQKLVHLLNTLHGAMTEKRGDDAVGQILKELFDYAAIHFKTEEKYFDQFGFEGADAHKKEHQDFIERVQEFKQKFDERKIGMSVAVIGFLNHWLQDHIKGSDQDYVECFKKHGLK